MDNWARRGYEGHSQAWRHGCEISVIWEGEVEQHGKVGNCCNLAVKIRVKINIICWGWVSPDGLFFCLRSHFGKNNLSKLAVSTT